MDEEKRDTVVVEKNNSNPIGWIIGILVILILLGLFFTYGGFGLFNGTATSQGGDNINVDTPDTVNVQPSTGK